MVVVFFSFWEQKDCVHFGVFDCVCLGSRLNSDTQGDVLGTCQYFEVAQVLIRAFAAAPGLLLVKPSERL